MPPRRKKAKVVASDATIEVATSSGANAETKARAPTRRNLRGRRGSLKDMLNMPLDVLYEIFGRMHPRDLLNLARTSKDFRMLLMSRDSALFWKAAREQVPGLPECPAFLSEPQYANLLFSSFCNNCLKKNAQMFVWEFFVRVVREAFDMRDLTADIQENTGIKESFYSTALMPRTKHSYSMVHYVHTPEYEKLKTQWKALETAEEKISFAKTQVALVKARIEPAKTLASWKTNELQTRSSELDGLKQERLDSILAHLRKEGWAEDIKKMDYTDGLDLRSHKAVRKPQKLTDSAWESIRGEIVALMEEIREARLQRERDALWSTRLELMCQVVSAYDTSLGRRTAMSDTQAQFADLALMPPFRTLVDAPPDTSVTAQDFENLRDSIPTLRAEWLEARRAEILELIPQEVAQASKAELSLSLAFVGFECAMCSLENLRWPNVLAHSCLRPKYSNPDAYKQQVAKMSSMISMPAPWRGKAGDLLFSERWKITRSVISALGKDPDTTTYEEMMQHQARMICLSDDGDPMEVDCRQAHDWKSAVVHVLAVAEEDSLPGHRAKHRWHVLDASEAARVIALEEPDIAPELDPNNIFFGLEGLLPVTTRPKYCCSHCRQSATRPLIDHCITAHAIKDPRIDEDFYVHPDRRGTLDIMKPVYVYPDGEDNVVEPDFRAIVAKSIPEGSI
ncbi:hypothetical protein ONZ51_g2910 [Trametes cubensis]|uniref:F-box domain-containing protein n=1 Tax=Trametes cubensis TaxID=1111947 RepID=A0AAD7TYR7_9APHY|nr:hypothetical protein ONZ51_g2910 [Trametes cubensis]